MTRKRITERLEKLEARRPAPRPALHVESGGPSLVLVKQGERVIYRVRGVDYDDI